MAAKKTTKPPEFADLKGVLAQTKNTDGPMYQVVSQLIDRLTQQQKTRGTGIDDGNGGGGGISIQGPQGPPGAQGPPGPTGASSSVLYYRADITNTGISDPGAGKMKWNTVDQSLATILIFDRLTDDGFDATIYLTITNQEDEFIIQDADFALNYKIWRQTGPAEILADFFVVPVEFIEGSGDFQFSQLQRLAIILKNAGSPGPPGPMGPPGPTGPKGEDLVGEEVFVGPLEPSTPETELWFDTDAIPGPASGIEIVSRGVTLSGTITVGLKGLIRLPFNATILTWTLMADIAVGDLTFSVKVNPTTTYPPTTSIVGGSPPKLTAQSFNSDAVLTGWTKDVNAGDIMSFEVTSITGTPGFVVLQIDMVSR